MQRSVIWRSFVEKCISLRCVGLRIPLSLRHEHEVPKSAPKTPKYSKLIPKTSKDRLL